MKIKRYFTSEEIRLIESYPEYIKGTLYNVLKEGNDIKEVAERIVEHAKSST